MKTEITELLGSQLGAVEKEYGSGFVKRIKKLLKKTRRKQRNLNIINLSGAHVNLNLMVFNNKEEISQLIMECHGNINNERP